MKVRALWQYLRSLSLKALYFSRHGMTEGKGIRQDYWEQEPPPLRSEVARAIRDPSSCLEK